MDASLQAKAGRWPSGFTTGCLTGAVLMLALAIALGAAVRRAPERYPAFLRDFYGAIGPITPTTGATDSLTLEQLQAIRGVQPTIQVTVTEADINSYLEAHPEAVGLPQGFSAPRVHFSDGRVKMSVRARLLIIPVRVIVAMEPRVEDKELRLSVVEVDAGGVKLPGELRGIAEKQVSRLLSERLLAAGLEPQAVEVGEGTLTVAARLIPLTTTEGR